jgi:S-adenosylmethionine-diacylglycerol 3-amino-3-carboxypropyl transferase
VAAIYLNSSHNHLVELKSAALRSFPAGDARAFLGAVPASAAERERAYAALADGLSPGARAYWDARRKAIADGVLSAGVTEKFLRAIVLAVRLLIHPLSRMRRLLAYGDLEGQIRFFEKEWDTPRWRFLFYLLLNRAVFNRTYHPGFFANVENPGFSRHFRGLFERTLRHQPGRANYFLHFLVLGRYDPTVPDALPPYLEDGGAAAAGSAERLLLADATFTEYLRAQAASSLDGYSLSNIGEWHDAAMLEDLFAEILRTAKPGAVLCFRNFVGWTDVPARFAAHFPLDPAGDDLIKKDRSLMQSRFAFCRIRKEA